MTAQYQLGMCIPSGCTQSDAVIIFDTILKIVVPDADLPTNTFCQPLAEEKEWSGLAKTA